MMTCMQCGRDIEPLDCYFELHRYDRGIAKPVTITQVCCSACLLSLARAIHEGTAVGRPIEKSGERSMKVYFVYAGDQNRSIDAVFATRGLAEQYCVRNNKSADDIEEQEVVTIVPL